MGHNYSHVARCSMCRYGDPTKSLKRNRGHQKRLQWKEILHEATQREELFSGDLDSETVGDEPMPISNHAPLSHRIHPSLKEFIVKSQDEFDVSKITYCPITIVQSLCPAGCLCKSHRFGRRSTQIFRNRIGRGTVGRQPPREDEAAEISHEV